MRDLIALPLLALAALAMIALALVWPQGQGTRSPGPFGRSTVTAPARAASPAPGVQLRGQQPVGPPPGQPPTALKPPR